MKKYLVILILLLSVNLTTPNSYRTYSIFRQNIENVQKISNRKMLDDKEVSVSRTILISDLIKLQYRIYIIDKAYLIYINSS